MKRLFASLSLARAFLMKRAWRGLTMITWKGRLRLRAARSDRG
jgi:hypothetical protein